MSERFAFGAFELDVDAFRLLRDGAPIAIQPKALELLILVVAAGGALVEHERLRSALWPDVVVTEQSLRQVLLKLREALGDHQDWVQTVPRKGLRFVGPQPQTASDGAVARAPAGALAAGDPGERSDVPAERDRFVGRVSDLGALGAKRTSGARLITILGPGGVGKTRLAVRYAHLTDWPGGAWFCDLSAAWTLEGIVGSVAKVLGVPLGSDDPIARIGRGIAYRGEALIVLDNFEQVASYAQDSVGRWLDRAPLATFLVTSRSALGITGEHCLMLDPLAPDDAAALFADRSSASGAAVSADEPAVRSLVGLLDHLPLAIELAAARGRVLSPARLVERIGERFDLLRSSGRIERHSTLRATLEWSWELSSAEERSGLADLVVFEGAFSLQAAEAVVDVGVRPLDVIEALVDRSWIRRVSDDRFELLATVREYISEKLAATARRSAEIRHGRWYAGRPLAAEPSELPNLVVALRRALHREDAEMGAALLERVWLVLELRGPFPLGLTLAEAVLALPLEPPTAGRAALTAGTAARLCGRGALARGHFSAALSEAVSAADRALEAAALVGLAVLDAQEGRVNEAERILRSAMAIHQDLGDRLREVAALHDLAGFAMHRGALADAEASLRASLALLRTLDAPQMEARTLGSLGAVLVATKRREEALTVIGAALEAHRASGSRRGESVALRNLGNAHLGLERHDDARLCYEAALQIAGELGDLSEVGVILGNLGNLYRTAGSSDKAREHFARALQIAREVSDPAFEGWLLGRLGRLDAAEGLYAEAMARFDAAEALLQGAGHVRGLEEVRAHRAEAAAASEGKAPRQ